MKTSVLLSGCGVFDGAEIQESVFTVLSLCQNQMEYICISPNINQHHVINHLNGEEITQTRNVLEESARIVRGHITSLEKVDYNQLSSLVIPGGFGSAKNFSDWAFNGPNGIINNEVKQLILHCIGQGKPIVTLCISPVLIAKALENSEQEAILTLGSTKEKSEYNIAEIHDAIMSLGQKTENKLVSEIMYDEDLKIISAPCYMMDASIPEIYSNVKLAIDKLKDVLN
jgi:enhancing lycopene biosynthesis protein 2